MIAGLLLAAGRSSRFGSDKLCAKLNGRAIVRQSIGALASTDAVYVVIPPGADALMQALSRLDAHFVINLGRDEGLASSIRAGIEALPPEVEAVVIALGDQPLVPAQLVATLVARWREGDADAVAPMYRNGQGNPVLFARNVFPELLALRGDHGARSVVYSLGDRVVHVPADGDIPADIDTPEALAQLAAMTAS